MQTNTLRFPHISTNSHVVPCFQSLFHQRNTAVAFACPTLRRLNSTLVSLVPVPSFQLHCVVSASSFAYPRPLWSLQIQTQNHRGSVARATGGNFLQTFVGPLFTNQKKNAPTPPHPPHLFATVDCCIRAAGAKLDVP